MLEDEKDFLVADIENRYYELDKAYHEAWEQAGSEGPEPLPGELTAQDQKILRSLVDDESADIRYRVAWLLAANGPLAWSDVKRWLLDADEGIRSCIVSSVDITYMAIGRLCATDKQRCADLLAQSWRKYPSDTTDGDISIIAMREDGWLHPTWRAMDRLLNTDDPELLSRLTCGYFEDMVDHYRMGPADPHIKPWIEGRNRKRKCVLLEIAWWFHLDKDFLVDIVRAIAADRDRVVAAYARKTLAWKHIS